MNHINLITKEGCQVITFPDGEKHLKLEHIDRKEPVVISCRITSSDDLFILMQLSDILNRQEVHVQTLNINYLMSMRCDRLFSLDESFTLKIVANVINLFNAEEVHIVEPHSSCTGRLINECYEYYPMYNMVDQMLEDYVICYPDKGAQQRYNYNCSRYICCEKQRDVETGKLLKFSISESKVDPYPDKIVVVDDLCDGGGTFLGIAELLKSSFNPESLVLVITHAVQLEGLKRVAEVYDQVYVTNSYCDWDTKEGLPENVTVIEL